MYFLELGGEDDAFAACEARNAAVGVERVAPGVATAGSIQPARVAGLAYTHRVSRLLARTDASVESARAALRAVDLGVDRERTVADAESTIAVRARDVHGATGVSTREAERELGAVLVDRGFAVDLDDPDHELRAVFSGDTCLLGWLAVESVRDYGDRKPTDRPFFQPGGMAPLDARALANIAGAGPETRVLDPMCGTGGVLIEAGLLGADVVGSDAQWKMARGTQTNLDAYLGGGDGRPDNDRAVGTYDVTRADATALPFRDDSFDAAVFDVPYGRQSKVARHELRDLVSGALSEARRVAPRAVVVADQPLREVAVSVGWRVEELFEKRVHGSLTRYSHVLTRESGE
ncbi:THUMP domain-containing protein [Salinirubrum litoreum]|uniref:tRNA (guanine(10)-N(2))-dimethyltransferase n=1 Tax=Salinirubrum litoreum TaxID=1126234 RepID=A0ABD5RDW4_9EURY